MQHPTGANPPKGEWTDSHGRRAGAVYHDPHGRRRVFTPPEFHADDGQITTGHEAVAALCACIDTGKTRTAMKRTTSVRRPRPRGAGRPRVRTATRSSAKSGDSGSDEPEPSEEGACSCGCNQPRRFCACGCRREITHRRADAKTFAASCRQKIKRAADRERLEPLAARACQCEGGFFYRDAEGDAVCGLCGCWLARIATPINGFDGVDALLRSNGVYVAPRLLPREWRTRLPWRSSPKKGAACPS
jgi:hypothetical protein